ncbi:signal peptidase II [Cyanobium sp. WAJ14-Wanaka]|uniref:signal peptidase II n=1 Tax=Cyanobium sp. WAJ14-Wanaka TaxID=2823725 RepID=UPI0020CD090B|nr:signal peptidase II [Cyanobium sp. WAJ14-Wanaka]MCP9774607.1 signal peptidase II [Cyanobium sp. WAJ14-Wanaka]
MRRSRPLVYGLAILVALLDQLSKLWATTNLLPQRPVQFLPGLLDLQLTHNTGAAFSLLTGSTKPLAVVSLAVAIGVVVWCERHGSITLLRQLGTALVLGGAIGNGLDRWRAGAVVDFLALVPIHFPIFNGADVAINLAVLFFAIDLLRGHGKSHP